MNEFYLIVYRQLLIGIVTKFGRGIINCFCMTPTTTARTKIKKYVFTS